VHLCNVINYAHPSQRDRGKIVKEGHKNSVMQTRKEAGSVTGTKSNKAGSKAKKETG